MDANTPVKNNEISLKELIEKIKIWGLYLFSQWKVVFLVSFLGAVLGLTYSFIKKPIYTATLSFAIEDEKSGGGLGGALGLASSLGIDVGGGGGSIFSGPNLTELFKSRLMVEKALLSPVNVDGKVISLAEMYIINNGWRERWSENSKLREMKFLPDADRKNFTRSQDSIMGKIYDDLLKSGSLVVAQKDKKMAIINIDVSSIDESFAKYFCESLAKKVGKFYVETKSKKARINMNILEHQTDSIRKELNNAITGVAVANDNTFNLNPALLVRRTPSARRQVDVQANTAILTELVKQTELAKVSLRKETPLIQVIDLPILPLKKEKFGKTNGVILGGFIGAFLSIFILIFRKVLKSILEVK